MSRIDELAQTAKRNKTTLTGLLSKLIGFASTLSAYGVVDRSLQRDIKLLAKEIKRRASG